MKLTKTIEKSNNYNMRNQSLYRYLYIIYKDENEKEIFRITIQIVNKHYYNIYFELPIQLNIKLEKPQISQLWFRSFFFASIKEIDRFISKYLDFLEKIPDNYIKDVITAVRACGKDYRKEAN